jgi:hypothetical protein
MGNKEISHEDVCKNILTLSYEWQFEIGNLEKFHVHTPWNLRKQSINGGRH